jgi:hypothetical protein
MAWKKYVSAKCALKDSESPERWTEDSWEVNQESQLKKSRIWHLDFLLKELSGVNLA